MAMRKRFAVLLGQPEESYQNLFLQGFLKQAFSDDYDVCMFAMYQKHQSTKLREQGESNIFALVETEMFDAVIVLADTIQTRGVMERLEEELHAKCVKPVIFVDAESKYFPTVTIDHTLSVKRQISHLIECHGFTDIAYLTGNEFHPHAKQRLQGFLDCMEEHGLEVGENRVFYGDFWYNSGVAAAEKLLRDREHLPQAVACANDHMAIGLMNELTRVGIRVPEDIAVVGYDDSAEGKDYSIPVTSVPIPAKACGEYCAKYADALLAGKEMEKFSVASEPLLRRSCGCDGTVPAKDGTCCEKSADTVNTADILSAALPSGEFDFNDSTMEDDMLMQTELSGVVNTIFSYVDQIRPFEGFHLCLNTGWSDVYTDRMLDALQCGPSGRGSRVDLTAEFDRKILLPELFEESEKPRGYFFTPLFFEEHNFGYAAVNYGETIRCYDGAYKRWLGAVMRGLECLWRVNLLSAKNALLETGQTRDSLTGMYNYRGFIKTAAAALKELEHTDALLDMVVVELCGLNEIYMNLGSQDGDQVVMDFAQILFGIPGKKMLSYLGNGEFLIARVLHGEEDGTDAALIEGVRQKMADYCHSNGLEGKLKLSFGTMHGKAENEEKLGNLVGEAVSRKNSDKIKEQRREQNSLTEDESRKLEIVADILDNNRLVYFFQPIVDAGSGEIFAYEALMRANTSEPVSPLDILKYAGKMGRLDDVERATFLNILTYMEEHGELFADKKVFVNSIPGTKLSREYAKTIREKLKNFNGKVVVELTEQAELDDSELEELKKKYKKLGVDTAVDDYGTGYSNVYNLLRYMPNFVKIDRMLLASIQLSAQKQHFVKEIIEFAHNNQITVLAEGVETTEELKMVTFLGVDLIQGYYTARPNAEVISRIDHKIQNEIVQYGQFALEKSRRKVYQAGQDGRISLIKLATGQYSKIKFTKENVPHRDVSINGLQGFQANMEIVIEDSFEGRIELRDVDLAMHNEQPAIKLGEHCDVTLVLRGENVLEQGGILVPETSRLTIQGDGNLKIKQIAVNGYGIGNDKDSRCGDLYFEQDGLIEIGGNTMHAVGIGAGYGGNIHMERGLYSIKFAGEEAVGIGSLYADVNMSIKYCAVDLDIRNKVNVGVGSLKGSAVIDAFNATIRGTFNASRCVCIGTLEGESAFFCLAEGVVDIEAYAECLCGIGSISGGAKVSVAKFSVKVRAEGKQVIAMGNLQRTAVIRTQNGNLVLHVKNQMDYDVGAETFEIINGYNEFVLNGNPVERKITEGEM